MERSRVLRHASRPREQPPRSPRLRVRAKAELQFTRSRGARERTGTGRGAMRASMPTPKLFRLDSWLASSPTPLHASGRGGPFSALSAPRRELCRCELGRSRRRDGATCWSGSLRKPRLSAAASSDSSESSSSTTSGSVERSESSQARRCSPDSSSARSRKGCNRSQRSLPSMAMAAGGDRARVFLSSWTDG